MSNSDAHSPAKLGREANLLDIDLSYPSLADALNGREAGGLAGTIEFFPEEGKYHFDGHRNCEICLTPAQTVEANGRCPVCGGKLTIGVLHRVEQLADREEGVRPAGAPPFESLIPLQEVIAASSGISATGKKAQERYERMLGALGPEFHILRQTPIGDIERASDPCVAEGIRRMREGHVSLSPGFDGEYGRIQILSADEIAALSGQLRFFAGVSAAKKKENAVKGVREQKRQEAADTQTHAPGALAGLNDEQRAAVTATEPAVTVVAGPGTGKTKTLVARIVHLVQVCGVKPAQITAVTFTNKAAGEMRERLEKAFGSKRTAKALHIGTFHALCLRMLSNREESVTILDENEASPIAAEVIRELSLKLSPAQLLREVSARKCGMPQQEGLPEEAFTRYNDRLRENGVLDYDDILLEALALFEQSEHEADLRAFSHLLVDEFQDINDVQYRLVRAWSRKSEGLFVIGDPDQSIYGFRGSDARCFERLWGEREDVRRIRLLRNYRSTPEILGCSLPVIARNHGDAGECALEAQRESGRKVRLLRAADDFQEAVFVAKEINRMAGGK